MTMYSVPVDLDRPRDVYLPPHLEKYSATNDYLRNLPITNAAGFIDHHDPSDDLGGEDFTVNILAHDGLPAIEIALTGVPSGRLARQIERAARKARSIAADKALDRENTLRQSELPEGGSQKEAAPAEDTSSSSSGQTIRPARLCQVSFEVDKTLETLQKLMPGKRLSDRQLRELAAVLSHNHKAFAKDSKDVGKVTEKYECKHSIATEEAKPAHQKPYRHSRFEEDFLRTMIEELKLLGLIRTSTSPWISPVVLVKKKGGDLRMCIDFRKLNAVTKRDPYQLPRIDALIDRMQGCAFFSNIDVLSAFWNVPMVEEDIQKTGFTTAFGNYEWLRMPFGLINASSTFQRLMDKVTSGLENAAAYIDDVFVFSKTWEEHLTALDSTLARLIEAGLKCKLSKCSFGGDSVKCLGQQVSQHGVTIDEDKLQAIRDLPRPVDASAVRSFIGFVNYFRQYIDKYAEICVPLINLTKKKVEWEWTSDCEKSFQELKAKLSEKPILAMPDFSENHPVFKLHTDWSKTAIGAVLLQQDRTGKEHAIAYASRVLNSAERNYAPTEGECLAVVWAVKKFRHYLHGRRFEILTDHHALKWLQEARFNNSKLERWALALQEHDYTIDYHKGEDNVIADCLSRVIAASVLHWDQQLMQGSPAVTVAAGVDLDELSKAGHFDYIRCTICDDPGGANNMAFCSGCNRPYHLRCHMPPMATVPIGDWYCLACKSEDGQLEELYDPHTLLQYFPRDYYLNTVLMQSLNGGDVDMPAQASERRALRRFLKKIRPHPVYPEWIQVSTRAHKLGLSEGRVWRTSPPLEYRWGTIRMYHDLLGHSGIEHTHRAMAKQVYWPNIKKDITAYCLACIVCQQRKAVMYDADTRENTQIHGALKHIHVDLAGPLTILKKTVTFEGTVAEITPRRSSRARTPASQEQEEMSPDPPAEPAPKPSKSTKKSRPQQEVQSKTDPPAAQQHWVLLIIDYFTKAAELVAIPTKSSEHISRVLYDQWFCRYGVPTYLTSDNGTEFQGEFTAMLERLGVVHITTGVRHPQANGVCERLVGTFKRKLFSYCDGHPTNWVSYLPRLRYAYMQEVHSTTHYSPFEMVYGFTPSHPLPVKINVMDASNPGQKSYLDLVMNREIVDADVCQHVENLRDRHLRLDSEVIDSITDAQDRDIKRFLARKDRFHRSLPTARVGDYVFEIRESPKPMQAIADGPFQVVSRHKDQAMLRTGVTKWDPVPKEFSRKVDFLAPCLTKRQALAKAYGIPVESAIREALNYLAPNTLLELSFSPLHS